MIKYKLTDQNMQTYKGFQWKLGEWQEARGSSEKELCSDGWLHCYDSPLLAILHNPLHANIHNPKLFEVDVDGDFKNDKGMKCGFKRMRLVREIPVPKITTEQKITYAILCAKQVYKGKEWNIWADNWLSKVNRTVSDAYAAADAATATYVATYAAYATADAAAAVAEAATYATAATAKAAAVIEAATYVATYAATAAEKKINLIELAEESMK